MIFSLPPTFLPAQKGWQKKLKKGNDHLNPPVVATLQPGATRREVLTDFIFDLCITIFFVKGSGEFFV